MFAVLGAHRLLQKSRWEDWVPVKQLYFHPKYRSPGVRTWAYDMVLIELRRPGHYEQAARAACLPANNQAPAHREICLVVGWGRTECQFRSIPFHSVHGNWLPMVCCSITNKQLARCPRGKARTAHGGNQELPVGKH